MGCDIHCYVEYKRRGDAYWYDFGGRINPGRNYKLFGVMAGVRCEGPPVAPLRGFPGDAASAARNDNWVYVSDGEREKCDRWVAQGCSVIVRDGVITHPDWHSHSWLTLAEFEQALAAVEEAEFSDMSEYRAVLAAMRSLEASGYVVRLVFWFDN